MDAAIPNRIENHRLLHRKWERSASMANRLTESEFASAISDGLPRLVAVARRLTGDEDHAQEAVQIALLKASKSWRTFKGQSDVHTWVTRIVIHATRDVLVAKRKRAERIRPNPESEDRVPTTELPGQSPTPPQQLMNRELNQVVFNAVETLPDRQREVFALSVWQGFSASEIGTLLEISAQAVHSNLNVARTKLKELLADYVDSQGRNKQ